MFNARNCQVYFGNKMSFECKAWLGVMNNKVGETHRQSTTEEKVNMNMNLAIFNPFDFIWNGTQQFDVIHSERPHGAHGTKI